MTDVSGSDQLRRSGDICGPRPKRSKGERIAAYRICGGPVVPSRGPSVSVYGCSVH